MTRRLRFAVHVTAGIAAILVSTAVNVAGRAEALDEGALLSLARVATENDHLMGVLSLEDRAIAAAGGRAKREDDRLVLRLRSGADKSYADRPECRDMDHESKCEKFRLVAYARSRHLFVVVHALYEDVHYLLVDDLSGAETSLKGFPLFSPTGEYVLVTNAEDDQVGFSVQVWRRAGHRYQLDWQDAPFSRGTVTSLTTYKLLGWSSDRAFAIEAETQDEPPAQRAVRRFVLYQSAGEWRVIEAP